MGLQNQLRTDLDNKNSDKDSKKLALAAKTLDTLSDLDELSENLLEEGVPCKSQKLLIQPDNMTTFFKRSLTTYMEKGRGPSNIRLINLSDSPTTDDISSCLTGQHDFPDKGMDASFQQSVPMLLSTCASKMLQTTLPK